MQKRHWTMGAEARFREDRVLQLLIGSYVAFWLWMLIKPYTWSNWWLENLLVLAAAAGLAGTFRWFRFSNVSYLLIVVFLALHTYGAHFSYNTTPLDEVMRRLFGFKRDNFDRVVHASFGLLCAYPTLEVLHRVARIRRSWCFVLTPVVILAFGALYELIEMWVAMLTAPEIGTMFLGMQGDEWDSQHDMEAALYGALAAVAVTGAAGWWRRRQG